MSGIMYERIPDADHAVYNRHAAARRAAFHIASTELRPQRTLAIIDGRAIAREQLSRGLISNGLGLRMAAYGSVDEIEAYEASAFSVILVRVEDSRSMDNSIVHEIGALVRKFPKVPVIVQAKLCGFQQILSVLQQGAHGYLPGDAGISVCTEAISMALAGGVFVAAENLLEFQRIFGARNHQSRRLEMFTRREHEVIGALRQGKANKTIAYALGLAPNTVKVHMRNILKKVRATNRTEAIYKINAMFDEIA